MNQVQDSYELVLLTDTNVEGVEFLEVELSLPSPNNYEELGELHKATVIIVDDDDDSLATWYDFDCLVYTAMEDAATLTINVNKKGDLSVTSTVRK